MLLEKGVEDGDGYWQYIELAISCSKVDCKKFHLCDRKSNNKYPVSRYDDYPYTFTHVVSETKNILEINLVLMSWGMLYYAYFIQWIPVILVDALRQWFSDLWLITTDAFDFQPVNFGITLDIQSTFWITVVIWHWECRGRWFVLVDAAKGCSTDPPDLARYPADFVVFSFYKVYATRIVTSTFAPNSRDRCIWS